MLTVAATTSAGYVIYHAKGPEGALVFVACYVMELSLSVDNMFAFYLIFQYFKCPEELQSLALMWGIVGAIVLRAVALVAGSAAVHAVKPLMLLFAVALFWSAAQMSIFGGDDDEDEDVGNTRVVRLVQRLIPVTSEYHGGNLCVREEGKWRATPLMLVLLTIELSDIVFAIDSVPAVLGMSSDELTVYLAVMCAVLSLRSIYAVTVLLIQKFVYLQPAVALLLGFIGTKITLSVLFGYELPTSWSLVIIGSTLFGAVLLSLCVPLCKQLCASLKWRLGRWQQVGTPFSLSVPSAQNGGRGSVPEELRGLQRADEYELEAYRSKEVEDEESPPTSAKGNGDARGAGAATSDASNGGGDAAVTFRSAEEGQHPASNGGATESPALAVPHSAVSA